MADTEIMTFAVMFERRENGGLRVWSDDVPGLFLSGADAHAVLSDVVQALETLLEHNLGIKAKVAPVRGLKERLEENGIIPPGRSSISRQFGAIPQIAA